MRILIVDDDPHKMRQLTGFMREEYAFAAIEEQRSYQSGLRSAVENPPDVMILDMTMPTYDVGGKETGGRERRYAGLQVLEQLRRRQVATAVIVCTQFPRFGEGTELITLDELRSQLEREFVGTYRGTVFYQAADAQWKKELRDALSQAGFSSGERRQ